MSVIVIVVLFPCDDRLRQQECGSNGRTDGLTNYLPVGWSAILGTHKTKSREGNFRLARDQKFDIAHYGNYTLALVSELTKQMIPHP